MCGWMIISIMLLIFKEENQKDFKSKQYNKSEKVTQFVSLKKFRSIVNFFVLTLFAGAAL